MAQSLLQEFSAQVNREFYSAYLYLEFATKMKVLGLDGFSNWMRVQAQEEMAHATHMFDYAVERWDDVALPAIASPDVPCDTPLLAVEATLAHEMIISAHINALATCAMQCNDHAAYTFLSWYVNEQVEEESNAKNLLAKLKLIGDNTAMLLNMDKDLATRMFVDPFPAVV